MQIHRWPECPDMPPSGEPVLVRVFVPPRRAEARREVRAVLRAILSSWLGREVQLEETSHGPVCNSEAIDISLSYADGEAWIGLIRDGRIGIDVMAVTAFAEMKDVACDYLGPAATARVRLADDPARVFAMEWTAREASLKCLKRGLSEWMPEDSTANTMTIEAGDGLAAAVSCCGKCRMKITRLSTMLLTFE